MKETTMTDPLLLDRFRPARDLMRPAAMRALERQLHHGAARRPVP
jgi:hypothetical protein